MDYVGLTPSLLCGFGPLLLNMAIFALIYPLVSPTIPHAPTIPHPLACPARHSSITSSRRTRSVARRRRDFAAHEPVSLGRPEHSFPLTSRISYRHTNHHEQRVTPDFSSEWVCRLLSSSSVSERDVGPDRVEASGARTGWAVGDGR